MKVALVRGPSLNPYEMQNEIPLLPGVSLTAFCTSYAPEWDPARFPQLPVTACFWPDIYLKRFPFLRKVFNGLCSRVLGFSFHMQGLETHLQGFDIIHTLETHTTYSYQALQAATHSRSKLVVTVWETIPGRGESHPLRTTRKKKVREHADAFIAVTSRTAQMLEKEGVARDKIHVIPMGIDQTHFHPDLPDEDLRMSWHVKPGEFVWLCVARLVPEKGIEDILRAMASISRPVRLILVGRGPHEMHYQQVAMSLGIAERVVFNGSLPYALMPKVYASCDALVLASHSTAWWEEQFGYCLIEAMACGIPVVAARSGAIPEVVGDSGLLVEPQNPDALGQAMKKLMEDFSTLQAYKHKGLQRAADYYTHTVTAEKIGRVYAALMR